MADDEDDLGSTPRQKGLKLFFDVFKHLTTLSSGSIVILVTFLDKLAKYSQWQALITISLVGFLVAIVGSIIVMLSTARTVRRNETTDQLPDVLGNISYAVAVGGFAIGVVCLAVFGIKNLPTAL